VQMSLESPITKIEIHPKIISSEFEPEGEKFDGKISTKVVDIKFNEKNEAHVTLEFTEGDIVSENSFEGGNDINELENIKVRIVSCQSEDQLRSYRNEIKDAGLLVKYIELNDLFIKKKQSFSVSTSANNSTPAQNQPEKPAEEKKKRKLPEAVKEEPSKLVPAPKPEKSPEDLAKIKEIHDLSLTFKTRKELQTYTKQNSEFIIKDKELRLELQKIALSLPME